MNSVSPFNSFTQEMSAIAFPPDKKTLTFMTLISPYSVSPATPETSEDFMLGDNVTTPTIMALSLCSFFCLIAIKAPDSSQSSRALPKMWLGPKKSIPWWFRFGDLLAIWHHHHRVRHGINIIKNPVLIACVVFMPLYQLMYLYGLVVLFVFGSVTICSWNLRYVLKVRKETLAPVFNFSDFFGAFNLFNRNKTV